MEINIEAREKLEEFAQIILKWNKKINLISKNTEDEIWARHILDSFQLVKFISSNDIIYDLGSGAGLPAIVISIATKAKLYLIESDTRKSVFLNYVVNTLGLDAKIINERIENIDFNQYQKASKIISRAMANISLLMEFYIKISPKDSMILLKGKTFQKELDEAQKNWHFDYKTFPSKTSQESVVIEITNVRKKT